MQAYIPAASPVNVLVVPVPEIPPGFNVQVPEEGNPFKTTLPVAKEHVGCVIVPAVGAEGVAGCALIITLAEATEVHPAALVTVQVYVPAVSPIIKVLVPVPEIPPGFIVQVPDEGNPFKTTLPAANAHVGCVIVPAIGAEGVAGCTLITTFAEAAEVHPEALVTV